MIDQSVAFAFEVQCKSLYALVQLSRILRDSVLHFELCVEGSDDDEGLGLCDASSSVCLNKRLLTFLR